MVEAKLRVEVTHFDNYNTHYYGNVMRKKVVEDIHMSDFDKRDKNCIAPFGIFATISLDKSYNNLNGNKVDAKEVFEIKINRRYLEFVGYSNGGYNAFFNIDDKVYELYVKFDKNKKIKDLWLSEWLENGYFKDGDDADNIYKMNEFVNYETFE